MRQASPASPDRIRVKGKRYAVRIVKTLDGPLGALAGSVVVVADTGDRAANLEIARWCVKQCAGTVAR